MYLYLKTPKGTRYFDVEPGKPTTMPNGRQFTPSQLVEVPLNDIMARNNSGNTQEFLHENENNPDLDLANIIRSNGTQPSQDYTSAYGTTLYNYKLPGGGELTFAPNSVSNSVFQNVTSNAPLPDKLQSSTALGQQGNQGGSLGSNAGSPIKYESTDYTNNQQAQSQDFYKIKVPVTAANPGGYDIYKADGTKVDQGTFQSLKLNDTWIPDRSGAVQPGTNIGSGGNSQNYVQYLQGLGLWDKLDAGTKAFVESAGGMLQKQFDQGMLNVSINSDLLHKALITAQHDPNIISKYGDALAINKDNLTKSLGMINQDWDQSSNQLKMKQEADRKALEESQVDAGRVYSGFSEKARRQLATEQSGVIESSKRTLQQKLNTFGSDLESKYGTAGLGQFAPLTAGGLAYTPTGGITGSIKGAEESDIRARQTEIYNNEKLG